MLKTAIVRSLCILLTLAVPVVSAQTYEPKAWIEDFRQLKEELSVGYANLEWAIDARKLVLKQLSEQTEARLQQAKSEAEARKVIEGFLDAFGDGHLTVQWPQSSTGRAAAQAVRLPLCQRLDFGVQTFRPRIAYNSLSSFREVPSADSMYFPIGLIKTAQGHVGMIRIPIFSEYAFPNLCEQGATELGLTKDSACNEDCADRVDRTAANLLTAALVRQIRLLRGRGINRLVVDITGNGGGTNWTEPAARTLSGKSLRSPRQQFIRHPHWRAQLQQRLEVIEKDIPRSSASHRIRLGHAADILRKAIVESQQTCTRQNVWENQPPGCSLVVTAPELFPQSVLSYARSGTLPDLPSSRFLFYPSRYSYAEGVYAGPLMILVDQGTWSSAEYFAAMLRDNEAAKILGQPTGGAGCGFTNGGIKHVLKNSRATLKIPDCVRVRVDGSNEVAGITPDVLIPWRPNDNAYQRAQRVFKALQ